MDVRSLNRGEVIATAGGILLGISLFLLAWPRGEMTAVVAIVALVLTIFRGIIDKPGSPTGEMSVSFGWGIALLGGLVILAGAVWRSQQSAPRRKPSGVL